MMPKTKTIQDELIEALKGLTLKLEVKVVEVVASVPKIDTPDADFRPPREPINSTDEQKQEPPRQLFDRRLEAPSKVTQEPTLQAEAESKLPTDNGLDAALRRQLSQESKESPAPTVATVVRETIQQQVVKQVPVPAKVEPPKVLTPKAPAKPTLVKGELKIGSKFKAFITMDDSVKPPIISIPYNNDMLVEMSKKMSDMVASIDALPLANTINPGDLIFGKSLQDNTWYRAVVESADEFSYDVHFFDWGIREKLSLKRIRLLTLSEFGLSKYPACAVKVKFTNIPDAATKLAEQEEAIAVRVESYDDKTDTYSIEALELP